MINLNCFFKVNQQEKPFAKNKYMYLKQRTTMNNKPVLILLLILAISCNRNNDTKNNHTDSTPPVSVLIAEKELYKPKFTFTGTIKPFREANLGAAIPGRVEKLHFSEGDFVTKGSLIAQLSGEATAMARHEYEILKKDYQRIARLREKGSSTQQDYDHIKAKFKAAEAKYEFFKNNSKIRAPFSGVIVEYLVNEGETFSFSPGLEPGYSHVSGIVRLMQMNPVKINIDVNEKLIPELNNIVKTTITTDVYPDEIFEGEISFIRPVLSPASRTAMVEITVDNPGNSLMPGMFARANLEMEKDSLVFLPRHALLDRENMTASVWLIKNGRATKQETTIMLEHNGKMAVKNIQHGDTVVVSGLHALTENKKVRFGE